jgi:nitrogen regulatory protein P-II 1
MYLIMLVLDDPGRLEGVLASWERVGIRGATIVESTGIQRLKKQQVPMRYIFSAPGFTEQGHLTLFVIVQTRKLVNDCLRATQEIVTDLDGPNTGVFAAWPLAVVRGVPARAPKH